MARFICLYEESPHRYYLNLEQIEQINPEECGVYMQSGESYFLGEDEFERIMKYVNQNLEKI